MRVVTVMPLGSWRQVAPAAEAAGFDGLMSAEIAYAPFILLALLRWSPSGSSSRPVSRWPSRAPPWSSPSWRGISRPSPVGALFWAGLAGQGPHRAALQRSVDPAGRAHARVH